MPRLISFGHEVKALDDKGKVGGYLVYYGSRDEKDLHGEYFDKDTYYGPHDGDGADVLFHHGIPVKKSLEGLSQHIFKGVTTKKDDIGVWAETVLNQADEYEKAVLKLVKAGKVKWSSGSVDRVVRKEKDGKITRWPIIEASLTHTPAQPFGTKVAAIKALIDAEIEFTEDGEDDPVEEVPTTKTAKNLSLAAILNQYIDDRVDDGRSRERIVEQMARAAGVEVKSVEAVLSGDHSRPPDAHLKAFARALDVNFDTLKAAAAADHAQSIKGIFEETLATEGFSSWKLWDVVCNVIGKIALVAKNSATMGVKFDREAKLDELYDEFVARHKAYANAQIDDYIESGLDERFYLKSITDPVLDVDATKNIDLDDHSRLAVSALQGVIARFRGNREMRTKAGRMISEKNRKRMMALMENLQSAMGEMQKMLDESMPMASDAEKRAALTKHLMLKAKHREVIGV
jgi:transcriptional regulator with XRE-family HTH domain/phage head maturation protease